MSKWMLGSVLHSVYLTFSQESEKSLRKPNLLPSYGILNTIRVLIIPQDLLFHNPNQTLETHC